MHRLALAVLIIGCADTEPRETTTDAGSDSGVIGDPELPPQGHMALAAWLADGHYLAWACEATPQPARPGGAHGMTRICSNGALAASTDGSYPIGAASVKELHRNGAVTGFAVGLKLTTNTDAASWYWYEAFGDNVIADGAGTNLCAGCHAGAPRDHVFIQVR